MANALIVPPLQRVSSVSEVRAAAGLRPQHRGGGPGGLAGHGAGGDRGAAVSQVQDTHLLPPAVSTRLIQLAGAMSSDYYS